MNRHSAILRRTEKKRSGLSADRSFRLQNEFLNIIRDIHSSARSFKLTHDQLLDMRTKRLYEHKMWKRVPHHVVAHIQGYDRALSDQLWMRDLEWCLWVHEPGQPEVGRLYSKAEMKALVASEAEQKSPPELSAYRRVNSEKSTHCWVDSDGAVLKNKPYTPKTT